MLDSVEAGGLQASPGETTVAPGTQDAGGRRRVRQVVVDNTLAFATTDSKGQVTVLADQIILPEENRELFVLQKIDGVWKIARYMFNKTSAQ